MTDSDNTTVSSRATYRIILLRKERVQSIMIDDYQSLKFLHYQLH